MKYLKVAIYWVLCLIILFIVTLSGLVLVEYIKGQIFADGSYIMWIAKPYPIWFKSIAKWYLILLFIIIINKNFRRLVISSLRAENSFSLRHTKTTIALFLLFNACIAYLTLFNVTVITDNEIIDYKYSAPKGIAYTYDEIKKIETGIYGKRSLYHSKGDFYYIVELEDNNRVDLANMGGAMDHGKLWFVIEKMDIKLMDMDIKKEASMSNFKLCTEHLGKKYTDKIQSILEY